MWLSSLLNVNTEYFSYDLNREEAQDEIGNVLLLDCFGLAAWLQSKTNAIPNQNQSNPVLFLYSC